MGINKHTADTNILLRFVCCNRWTKGRQAQAKKTRKKGELKKSNKKRKRENTRVLQMYDYQQVREESKQN